MPKAMKTDDELRMVPITESVLVELPTGNDPGPGANDRQDDDRAQSGDGVDQIRAQLDAVKAAQKTDQERIQRAERDAAEVRRLLKERDEENTRLKADQDHHLSTSVQSGLAAAQAERDAAKTSYIRAFEQADASAMADAQSAIGRAEAKILTYEGAGAELDDRKRNPPPVAERQTAAPPQQQDFATVVHSNPNLLPVEKDWMIKNSTAFQDPNFNKELEVAYLRSMKKGLVRGTPAYFDFIEDFTGLKQAGDRTSDIDDNQRSANVSAPPSRNERNGDGRISNGRITLTAEQRQIAASMGVSDIEYAKGMVKFDQAKRDDPDRYR